MEYRRKIVISIVLVIGIIFVSTAQNTYAVFGVGDAVIVVGETSPTAIKRSIDTTMIQIKGYVLDPLASGLARMFLQQMTNSVVNWINTGFKGSPAFVSDPQGFFLDAADQITGDFLAKNGGPLTALCSPFSFDIRIALALGQSQNLQQRYSCTLGRIIDNTRNAVATAGQNSGITMSSNGLTIQDIRNGNVLNNRNAIDVSGTSVNGFYRGDFSAGGWPAFIAMVTEPQNNQVGAMYQTGSDLSARITAKQNAINTDLNRGNGFLSWQKCKDATTVMAGDIESQSGIESAYNGDTTLQTKHNKDGSTTYQSCTVETPGSVISGALQKQLGAPVDQLNLTNQINQIVNALMGYLVQNVLSGGLRSYSSGSASYTAQQSVAGITVDNTAGATEFNAQKKQVAQSLEPYLQSAIQYKNYRDQAVSAIQNEENAYVTARLCFTSKVDHMSYITSVQQNYANQAIAKINDDISSRIDPLLKQYQLSAAGATERLSSLQNAVRNINNVNSFSGLSQITSGFRAGAYTTDADLGNAQNDLSTAQAQAAQLRVNAVRYQNACDQFPSNALYSSGFFNI